MKIVIFLEERSAKEMLTQLFSRILPEHVTYQCIPFEGKNDLEKSLPLKLRGWRNDEDTRFIVLRDKDHADCKNVKQALQQICINAGKPDVVVRIACSELESWYLGDLKAVGSAFNMNGLARHQMKKKFRTPDMLTNAAQELKIVTKGQYKKIDGSRRIGLHLDGTGEQNLSHSFKVFMRSIYSIISLSQLNES
jgi:hypothetical protein